MIRKTQVAFLPALLVYLCLAALVTWPLVLSLTSGLGAVRLLGSMITGAGAMHLFVCQVAGSRWAAYTAAIIWGSGPYHIAPSSHSQLQALYLLPVAFLFLHRLVAAGRWRDALALGVIGGLQGVTSISDGAVGVAGIGCGAVALKYASGGRRAGRLVRQLTAALLVSVAIAGPFAWPAWRLHPREALALLKPTSERPAAPPWRVPPARQLWPGALALALAGIGLGTARRRGSGPLAASMTAVAAIGFLLSLGPGGLGAMYTTVHRFAFGVQAMRVSERVAVLLVFGVAVLAGLGAREVRSHMPPRDATT